MNIDHFHSCFSDFHFNLNYDQFNSSVLLSKFPKPFKEKVFCCINEGLNKNKF
jgi:hypothetical protein